MTDANDTDDVVPVTELPTTFDTQQAISAIEANRKRKAVAAIKELVLRMITTVQEVDAHHDVAKYINSLTLRVTGTGAFVLDIDDRDTDASTDEIMEEVRELLQPECYYKPTRDIQIGDDDESSE